MRFICDAMLGRLSKKLRMIGFDTYYYRFSDTKNLIRSAENEHRILLTRKTCLRHGKLTTTIIFITHNRVDLQLKEVIKSCNIKRELIQPFTICLLCNKKLESVNKERIAEKVPQYVLMTSDHFSCCTNCGKIYWQGTHYANMSAVIDSFFLI